MLPHLVNEKIYSHLGLEDKLNFQKAVGYVIRPESPFEEKHGYVCPICIIEKTLHNDFEWCIQYPEGHFLIRKQIHDIFRAQKVFYKEKILFLSFDSLIEHIYKAHLNEDTVGHFEVRIKCIFENYIFLAFF